MNEHQFIIEPHQISKEALDGILENYILREGTDYGTHIISMESKKAAILKQLQAKKVIILFDNELNSCNIMTMEDLKNLHMQNLDQDPHR